jgi:hypothetical protein
MAASELNLSFLTLLAVAHVGLEDEVKHALLTFLFLSGHYFFSMAMEMLKLDSELMDLTEEDFENAGYHKELVGVSLDHYRNDDECQESTGFTREDLRTVHPVALPMHFLLVRTYLLLESHLYSCTHQLLRESSRQLLGSWR